jgi:hypothetical protein
MSRADSPLRGRNMLSAVGAAFAVVVVAGLSGCGGTASTQVDGPPLPRDFFGMNAQIVAQAAQEGKLDYADQQVAEIAKLGVSFVRSSFDWSRVEPDPPSGGHHRYDFSSLDGWVGTLARHRLRWLVTVKGGPIPSWAASPSAPAECGTNAPPAGSANYAALMGALARRYGRHGSFWQSRPDLPYEPIADYEVWNEPNFGRLWCPTPDPVAYARLYLAARDAIHAVDSQAIVLVGGLPPFPVDEAGPPAKTSYRTFLTEMTDAQPALRARVDAVAVHPYGKDPTAVLAALKGLRAALDDVGLSDAPMLADEIGWHTKGVLGLPPVPEDQRADYFRAVTPAIVRSNCDVIGIAAHTWVTLEHNPNYPEDWYGMADPYTGQPYPSAIAYGDQVKALEAGKPVTSAPPASCG